MSKKTKKGWGSYKDYLRSPEWKAIKADYKKIYDSDKCVICDECDNLNHHHWQYPDSWSDDSPHNLILICEKCHQWIHDDRWINYILEPDANSDRCHYLLSIIKGMFLEKLDCEEVNKYLRNKEENISEIVQLKEKGKQQKELMDKIAETAVIQRKSLLLAFEEIHRLKQRIANA